MSNSGLVPVKEWLRKILNLNLEDADSLVVPTESWVEVTTVDNLIVKIVY